MLRHLTLIVLRTLLFLIVLSTPSFAYLKDSLINYGGFKNIISIAVSPNKVYAATTQGIIIYNISASRWEQPLAGPDMIGSETIQRIFVDQFDERLFVETIGGKYEYDATFRKWLPAFDLPESNGLASHISPPGVMFAPFGFDYNGNGGFIDPQGRVFTITDIVDDGAGSLWIGTRGYGLAHAGSISKIVEWLPYGLLQNAAYTMIKRDSLLYISGPVLTSRRTGISIFDYPNNSFEYLESGIINGFSAFDIQCLEVIRDRILVGTNQGLYLLNLKKESYLDRLDRDKSFISGDITSIKALRDSIFVGTTKGLVILTHHFDSAEIISSAELNNRIIYSLDTVGSYLWVGTDAGAYRLSLETGNLKKFIDRDKILFNRVFSQAHTNRYLWLASDGGVVCIDLDSGRTTPFSLPSSNLWERPIAVNDSVVAVGSADGVTLIFPFKDKPVFRDLTKEDGLISNYVYCLVFDGDYLWIGTDRGVTRLWWADPDVSY